MSTLCTFPGRYGDLLWALPTVRAISETRGEPVDLAIAGEFESILPLLQQQPYIRFAFAVPEWHLTPPEEWKCPETGWAASDTDEIFDLGYRGWPHLTLPKTVEANLHQAWPDKHGPVPVIDLGRPWITMQHPNRPQPLAVGFTEAWFELKVGLMHCAVDPITIDYTLLTPPGSRWTTEGGAFNAAGCTWLDAAQVIAAAGVFVGDCSALHVLAVALGKPCVIVEPMTGRLNDIFWPLGKDGQVKLVRGNDGEGTFDARAVKTAIEEALRG